MFCVQFWMLRVGQLWFWMFWGWFFWKSGFNPECLNPVLNPIRPKTLNVQNAGFGRSTTQCPNPKRKKPEMSKVGRSGLNPERPYPERPTPNVQTLNICYDVSPLVFGHFKVHCNVSSQWPDIELCDLGPPFGLDSGGGEFSEGL